MNFTIEELQDLMNLLDLATKAGGLQVAQKALPLAVKPKRWRKSLMLPLKPTLPPKGLTTNDFGLCIYHLD